MKKIFYLGLLFSVYSFGQVINIDKDTININVGHRVSIIDLDKVYVYLDQYNDLADSFFARIDNKFSIDTAMWYSEAFDSLDYYKIYDSLDVLVICGTSDTLASLLNFKGNYCNGTPVNNPTFTANQGWTGNGTSSYINTNFSPSENGVNYQPGSCSMGVYIRNNVAEPDGETVIGNIRTSSPVSYSWIFPKNSNILNIRLNITGSGQPSITSDSTQGFFQVHKEGTTLNISRNNSFTAYAGYATQTIKVTPPFFINATQIGGTPLYYGTYQIAAYYFGGSMSVTQRTKLFQIVERLLDHLGAGIL